MHQDPEWVPVWLPGQGPEQGPEWVRQPVWAGVPEPVQEQILGQWEPVLMFV